MSKLTRIVFASDLHGSEVTFRKLVSAAKIYKANALIIGGDITGKLLVPVIKGKSGWMLNYLGHQTLFKSEEERAKMMTEIVDTGYYPYEIEEDKYKEVFGSQDKIDRIFVREMIARVSNWVMFLEQEFRNSGIRVFVMPGNDDVQVLDEVLSSSDYVINTDGKVTLIENHEILTVGNANLTPWRCPRDVDENVLASKIENIAQQLKEPSKSIFNIHVPPFHSTLDICPKLDTSSFPPKPIPGEMIDAGSTAVRSAIEKYQPILGLHGHIHESRGIAKIGKTVCINPGSEYSEGTLSSVIVNLDENKVVSRQFVTG